MREYKPGPIADVEARALEVEAEVLCGADKVRAAKTSYVYSAVQPKAYINRLKHMIEEARDERV